MFDGQIAYRIPDDKRDEYFAWVDGMKKKCKLNYTNDETIWNTYNDPVIIVDMSYFTFHQSLGIKLFMSKIGAKDVTEAFFINA